MGFVPLRLILGVACLAVSLTGLCEAQEEEGGGLSVDFNETDIESELFPDLNSTSGELDLEQETSGEPMNCKMSHTSEVIKGGSVFDLPDIGRQECQER